MSYQDEKYSFTKGPCAAHVYLTNNTDESIGSLTLDWSYDSFYFKYKNDPWVVLSYGSRGDKNQPEKIDTKDKKNIFLKLKKYALYILVNHSTECDKALDKLNDIVF
jgi:hypothetical protein